MFRCCPKKKAAGAQGLEEALEEQGLVSLVASAILSARAASEPVESFLACLTKERVWKLLEEEKLVGNGVWAAVRSLSGSRKAAPAGAAEDMALAETGGMKLEELALKKRMKAPALEQIATALQQEFLLKEADRSEASGAQILAYLAKQQWCSGPLHAKVIADCLLEFRRLLPERPGQRVDGEGMFTIPAGFTIRDIDTFLRSFTMGVSFKSGTTPRAFSGKCAVDWLLREKHCGSRTDACDAMSQLIALHALHSATTGPFASTALLFKDTEEDLYRFSKDELNLEAHMACTEDQARSTSEIAHSHLIHTAGRMRGLLTPIQPTTVNSSTVPKYLGSEMRKWLLSEGTARTEAEADALLDYMIAARIIAIGAGVATILPKEAKERFSTDFAYVFVEVARQESVLSKMRVAEALTAQGGKKWKAAALSSMARHEKMGRVVGACFDCDESKAVARSDAKKASPPLGVLRIDYGYPPVPGDIDHPSSFDYPVVYRKVSGLTFENAQAAKINEEIRSNLAKAVKELEGAGVFGITGDCGFLANYQGLVRQLANVPVFLSSLNLLPAITPCLGKGVKCLVATANSNSLRALLPALWDEPTPRVSEYNATNKFLAEQMDVRILRPDQFVVVGFQDVPGFDAVAKATSLLSPSVDTELVTQGIIDLVLTILLKDPSIGIILFECTELPHYSVPLRKATGLPVFDSLSVCNFMHDAFSTSAEEANKRGVCLGHHCQISFPDTPLLG